ncbi:MAG TPA: cation:proton antiporter [Kofleriaceae bacterium]|nr:cation:proton antiporter [Kofleriaceae bacterium]
MTASLGTLLVGLTVMLVAAKAAGELFERLGQPAVIGELLVGIVLANLPGIDVAALLRDQPAFDALAGIGVVLMLFEVGLGSNVTSLMRVGGSAFCVATVGVIAPMVLGGAALHWLRPALSVPALLFIAATLAATSVGITARVYKDLGAVDRPESRIVLGAAVIDDVMGLVVLAIVQGMVVANGSRVDAGGLGRIVLAALGFLAGAIVIGGRIAPRLFRVASFLRVHGMLLITALAICFSMSWAAAAVGLAPIVGAFAAGLVLDEVHFRDFADRTTRSLADEIRPLTTIFVPLFFVRMGLGFDIHVLAHREVLVLASVLTAAAIIGKQVCGLGVLDGRVDRLAVGIGMIPRGEVGLIVADAGRHLTLHGHPVIDDTVFSAVIVVVLATTLVTPPLVSWALARRETTSRITEQGETRWPIRP